jgi:phage-related protein
MVMEADDLASPIMTEAQQSIDAACDGIELRLVDAAEAVDTAADSMVGSFESLAENTTPFMEALNNTTLALVDAGEAIGTAVDDVESVTESVTAATARTSGFLADLRDIRLAAVGAGGALLGLVTGAFTRMRAAATESTVSLGGMLQKLIGIRDEGGGRGGLIGLGGGFLGATVLGPLGKILELLSPIIDAITEVLTPAFETLGMLVKNSLAPLGFIFETMAQQLAPLIQKAIQPLVSLLEIGAVHLGAFLAKALDTNGVIGSLSGLFVGLMPAVERVFTAFGTAATKILPVIFKLVEALVPIAVELVNLLAEHVAVIVEEIGKFAAEAGPELIAVFVDLLKALMPLIPPLLRLAQVLVKDVFSPLLLTLVRQLGPALREHVIPWIAATATVLGDFLNYFSDKLTAFHDGIAKTGNDLYELFVKPIMEGTQEIRDAFAFDGVLAGLEALFNGMIDLATNTFEGLIDFIGESVADLADLMGFSGAREGIVSFFSSIGSMLTLPLKALRAFITGDLLDGIVNPLLEWDPPVIPGGTLGQILGIGRITLPEFAEGGVVTGPTQAIVGEAGPEMILPLQPETFERMMAPMTNILTKIHQQLTSGTLNVRSVGVGGGDASMFSPGGGDRRMEEADLAAAIGFGGIGR